MSTDREDITDQVLGASLRALFNIDSNRGVLAMMERLRLLYDEVGGVCQRLHFRMSAISETAGKYGVPLVGRPQPPSAEPIDTCATCGFVGPRSAHRNRHVFTPSKVEL